MDLLEVMRKRRSVRKYSPEQVPEDALARVLEAGRLAPSANNYQPWRFVIVKDPDLRKSLSQGRYAGFLAESPVVIVGCGDRKRSPDWHVVDVTIALQNMVMQATAEGLGTCWIGSFDEAHVKSLLDIPEEYTVVAMLSLGYARDAPSGQKKAKAFEEIMHSERFGRPWKPV